MFAIIFSFFFFLTARQFFQQKKAVLLFYSLGLFVFLFISIVGNSVLSDMKARLEQFIEIEEKQEIIYAKQNLKNYDSMLAIDLEQFKDSHEFKEYVNDHACFIDNVKSLFMGFFFICLFDFLRVLIWIVQFLKSRYLIIE